MRRLVPLVVLLATMSCKTELPTDSVIGADG